jgi:hypothetical protein
MRCKRGGGLLADTATLRSRLGAALQPWTPDDGQTSGPTSDERPRMSAPSIPGGSGKVDGEPELLL